MGRTDEDKIIQKPVMVTLGGSEYEIKPLPIKYSLPWVQKMAKLLVGILPKTQITSDNPELFSEALTDVMFTQPGELIDLFFEYAKDLKRDEIEEVATSAEILAAFEEVIQLEHPLFGMTIRVLEKTIPREVSPPPSSSS